MVNILLACFCTVHNKHPHTPPSTLYCFRQSIVIRFCMIAGRFFVRYILHCFFIFSALYFAQFCAILCVQFCRVYFLCIIFCTILCNIVCSFYILNYFVHWYCSGLIQGDPACAYWCSIVQSNILPIVMSRSQKNHKIKMYIVDKDVEMQHRTIWDDNV